TLMKRSYIHIHYSDQDKMRFFKLLFERCLSTATVAAKQLGIHVRKGQKWATQYENDPNSIFEKCRKTSCQRILHVKHKNAILDFINENPSVVLDKVMKRLKQTFTELKVSKTTFLSWYGMFKERHTSSGYSSQNTRNNNNNNHSRCNACQRINKM
ncbi:hypothetical protein CLU79DRAFT_698008, partial [Phycomyces nitens]